MIGRTLSHFRITAKLGEGGMGEVYRAEDTRLERQVALKLLPEKLAADPERLDRFEREAKLLAALNHPGIGTVYSFEEAAPEGSSAAIRLLGDDPESIGSLGRAHGIAGSVPEARTALERLRDLGKTRFVPAFWPAVVSTGLGDTENAIDALEKAHDERFDWLNSLRVEPMVDGLRSDSRFQDLMARAGFIESAADGPRPA